MNRLIFMIFLFFGVNCSVCVASDSILPELHGEIIKEAVERGADEDFDIPGLKAVLEELVTTGKVKKDMHLEILFELAPKNAEKLPYIIGLRKAKRLVQDAKKLEKKAKSTEEFIAIYKLYKRAADLGSRAAMSRLGFWIITGRPGTDYSQADAYKYFDKAIEGSYLGYSGIYDAYYFWALLNLQNNNSYMNAPVAVKYLSSIRGYYKYSDHVVLLLKIGCTYISLMNYRYDDNFDMRLASKICKKKYPDGISSLEVFDHIVHPINLKAARLCHIGKCTEGILALEAELKKQTQFRDFLLVPLAAEKLFLTGKYLENDFPILAKYFQFPTLISVAREKSPAVRLVGADGYGSGTFIAKNTVLTSTHVIVPRTEDRARKMMLYSYQKGHPDYINLHDGWGGIRGRNTKLIAKTKNIGDDVAIIKSPNINKKPHVSAKFSFGTHPGYGRVYSLSYPGVLDKKGVTFRLKPFNPTGLIYKYNNQYSYHKFYGSIANSGGASGSAIFDGCNNILGILQGTIAGDIFNRHDDRLNSSAFGPTTPLFVDFLKTQNIKFQQAKLPCLRFGIEKFKSVLKNVGTIKYLKNEMHSGLLYKNSLTTNFLMKSYENNAFILGEDSRFLHKDSILGGTWNRYITKIKLNSVNSERGISTYKFANNIKQNGFFYGYNKNRLLNNAYFIVEGVEQVKTVFDLETNYKIGEDLYLATNVEGGSFDQRTHDPKRSLDKAYSADEHHSLLKVKLARKLQNEELEITGMMNPTSHGAPVFNSCGGIIGMIIKMKDNKTATVFPAKKIVESLRDKNVEVELRACP